MYFQQKPKGKPRPWHWSQKDLPLSLAMLHKGDLNNYGNDKAIATNNGATWTDGENGPALDFTTGTIGISLANTISFTGNNPWTLIWRCKQTGEQNEGMIFGDTSVGDNYIWFRKQAFIKFERVGQGTIEFANADVIADMTSLHTYALVAHGGQLDLYRDGVYIESKTPVSATAFDFANVAAGFNSLALSFEGLWEYNSIHSQALTAQQVKDLYDNPYQAWEQENIAILAAAQGGVVPPEPPTEGGYRARMAGIYRPRYQGLGRY